MSLEEENIAISHLVDMFPQHAREDLLRELRHRGSAEAVVELVLGGAFLGVRRNGAVSNDDPHDQVLQREEGATEEIAEDTNFENEEVTI